MSQVFHNHGRNNRCVWIVAEITNLVGMKFNRMDVTYEMADKGH